MSHYRLSRHVLPQHYEIMLSASPKRKFFSGTTILNGQVVSPTQRIELHARNLKFQAITVCQRNKKYTVKTLIHPENETVELVLSRALELGPVTLSIQMTGRLDVGMHGLYFAKDGRDIALVSQCEATDARAIFPCLDEPDLKATFRWIVRTDPGLTVVTNGIAEKTIRTPKYVEHRFKKTPVISTYLAAVTIGNYHSSPRQRISGISCRFFAGPHKLAQARFAAEVTAQVLPWYEKYFGLKYHYKKLDQVAVPGFDAGAMENVGAIFYRASLLLMQPKSVSWVAQKAIAETIAHEIAHQWFGNRVTMKWWDDLWLNEAFATWIALKVIDEWRPQWRLWDDYQEEKEQALFADALMHTHPIYTSIKTPAEATELFDIITYSKGGAVLRMTENFLGEGRFRSGIQRYMRRHKDSNATGDDLWRALGFSARSSLVPMVKNWIMQPGFPLVTVEVVTQKNKTKLRVSQERFSVTGKRHPRHQTWHVPMVMRYGDDGGTKTFKTLISQTTQTVMLPVRGVLHWLQPNADAIGFYRVHLKQNLLHQLLPVATQQLVPAERLSLLEDQWALVQTGRSDIEQWMRVMIALSDDRDYLVLRALASRLSSLDQYVVSEPDRPLFAAFVRRTFQSRIEEINFALSPSSESNAVSAATLFELLADTAQHQGLRRQATELADHEASSPAGIEPNLAHVVLRIAALAGDQKRLEHTVRTFLKRKQRGDAPDLQQRYLHALPSFISGKLPETVLALCLDGTIPQDQLRLILAPLLRRRETQQRTYQFLKKHWSTIVPRVGAMGISRLVETLGALPFSMRNDVEKFLTTHPVAEASRALKKALEMMKLREKIRAREGKRLGLWLRERL